MSQIKIKIQNLKLKIKNFDLENNEENEEKFLQDDLNYYKEKKILLEAEIELTNNKYKEIILTKHNEQKETEQKLVLKSEKLQKVREETDQYIEKIKETKKELLKMSKDLIIEEKVKEKDKKLDKEIDKGKEKVIDKENDKEKEKEKEKLRELHKIPKKL